MFWIFLSFFAGICNGAFALPMKFTTKWKWENIWGVFTFWGFVVFPIILGIITVPKLGVVFSGVDSGTLLRVFLFGCMWGLGSICFGLAISYIGLGLAFSINIGLTIVIGTLLPLLQDPGNISEGDGKIAFVILGVCIIVVGVIINGWAAVLRAKDNSNGETLKISGDAKRKHEIKGIVLCIVAGLMSPMLQVSFMYGRDIIKVANTMGVSDTSAPNLIWIIALGGGFVVNGTYAVWLLLRNNTFGLFKIPEAKRYHMLAVVMGFLWIVTIATYGIAVSNMGNLGLSVGWAIFNSVGIVCANSLGVLTHEWRRVRPVTMLLMIVGTVVIVSGTCFVAWGSLG